VKDREGGAWRTLTHGTTTHGGQYRDPARAFEPVTYYREDSGLGMTLASLDPGPRRIGVLGLGAGCLAVYGRPGDLMRFYELDPRVEACARRWFTYLSGGRAAMEVLIGDARLTLARQAPQAFDLLVMDAFSGDAVPVHLLTAEAFAVYFRHLRPGGVLAVNISNRYVDLRPVLLAAARRDRRSARVVTTAGVFRSTWVILAPEEAFFARAGFRGRANVQPLSGRALAWTDDFSDLLGVLR
jgi:spermidine synthase